MEAFRIDSSLYDFIGKIIDWAENYYNCFEEKTVMGSCSGSALWHLKSLKDSYYKGFNEPHIEFRYTNLDDFKIILNDALYYSDLEKDNIHRIIEQLPKRHI